MNTAQAPFPIILARLAAGLQAASATVLVAVCAWFGLSAYRGDREAERRGSPNEFAGLGEGIAIFGGLVGIVVLVVIAIPLLRLGAQRDGARIALIIGEFVVGGVPLVWTVGATGFEAFTSTAGVWLVAYVALAAVVVAMLLTPAARAYTRRTDVAARATNRSVAGSAG